MSNVKKLARDISRCYEAGFHSHMAGPCFRTEPEAVAFRDRCEFYESTHAGAVQLHALKRAKWAR